QGITNGNGTAADIHRIYSKLGYGVHAVSNYETIDTTLQSSPAYISAYEHGYNLLKTHQLVLGAKAVCWKDYLLPQTVNNKQNIINRIHETDSNAFISINHPMLRNGYNATDFTHLAKYNSIEVLNPACNSSPLWDAALSAGKPVFGMGDDDMHDVADSSYIGNYCTWINVPQPDKNTIIKALETGSSYAMLIGAHLKQQIQQGLYDSVPLLQSFVVKGDTVTIRFSLPPNEIIAIGQNGKLLHNSTGTKTVSFVLGKREPYARVVATYSDGTQLLLNPVFRYKQSPLQQADATINSIQTLLWRTVGVILLAFWFIFATKQIFLRKRKSVSYRF
ncbi:MAG: hypothetical protein M3R72_10345, partial [Bacteroidota bacterium]|nr:hypothetical protein [Bacteroidota bacterium]